MNKTKQEKGDRKEENKALISVKSINAFSITLSCEIEYIGWNIMDYKFAPPARARVCVFVN